MDIIALGKANAVLKKIKEIDDEILAVGAEGRFLNVKERLDWLEAQSSQLKAIVSRQVDLTKGQGENIEYKNGAVFLKEMKPGEFVSNGSWESDVIDLGEGWMETKSLEIISLLAAQ